MLVAGVYLKGGLAASINDSFDTSVVEKNSKIFFKEKFEKTVS